MVVKEISTLRTYPGETDLALSSVFYHVFTLEDEMGSWMQCFAGPADIIEELYSDNGETDGA